MTKASRLTAAVFMRRNVLARAVHHRRSIAYLGRSTPSENSATCEIREAALPATDRSRRTPGDISLFVSAALCSSMSPLPWHTRKKSHSKAGPDHGLKFAVTSFP